jgi:hypothetical protein
MVDVWCMIHDSRFTNNDSWLTVNDYDGLIIRRKAAIVYGV